MQRIAHKHVSLGIKSYEYTIVGHHLMWAIGDVLGDAVTPEIASAWDEVYWLFACQLIAEEGKLYALGGTDPEHPYRPYTVVERDDETPESFSLVIKPAEGELPSHRTGQYVGVAVDLPGGERHALEASSAGLGEVIVAALDAASQGSQVVAPPALPRHHQPHAQPHAARTPEQLRQRLLAPAPGGPTPPRPSLA